VLDTALAVLAVPATFLLLVAPHEGGHFMAAKLTGMRVLEFAVGMGPRLWGWTGKPDSEAPGSAPGGEPAGELDGGGTRYSVRLLPIGGYVRIGGMEPGQFQDPRGFHRRSALSRLAVLAAGPAANFVMAAVLVTGLGLTRLNDDPGKVHAVRVPSPAADSGIRPNDSIRTVNGVPLRDPADLRRVEDSRPGQPVQVTVRHPRGTVDAYTIQPIRDQETSQWIIGVTPEGVLTAPQAIVAGTTFPVVATVLIVHGFYDLVTGHVPGGVFGGQGVTGPIGIAAMTADAARAGFDQWVFLVAVLSMALGIANLLPIPALDGGRMVVVLAETVRGRPFDRDREAAVQRYGLAALLAVILLIAYFDVTRIATHQFPAFR
jgi:regulator of sigma E protease